ncbi:MAG: hypothetical protein ACKO96_12320, partial [Flammeovirgaceae bacterium]
SYLLTSILGPDYVDVGNDGVDDKDLGYWVKFTYQRTATELAPFKWRDPFMQAHFQGGWRTDPRDDKGSFVYGEKEMWYLRRAETRSHIAEFTISERFDGKGVDKPLKNDNATLDKSVFRLDKITLYSRFSNASNAIKSVRFQYVEDDNPQEVLCKNADNSARAAKNPLGGKLTLKKMWFEYGGSSRGSFSPYVFSYHSFNPDYQLLSYDRWGNYKPNNITQGAVSNNIFPYVSQDPTKKADIDNYAAAWSLTEIQMPSGGTVKVDYESDDYAYVQHKQAMQMTEIVDPIVESSVAANSTVFQLSDTDTKVRFKLKEPITDPLQVSELEQNLNGEQRKEVLKYIDVNEKQLYFKMMISLLEPHKEKNEYISGYVDIDDQPTKLNWMGLEKDATGKFAYGYFHVKKEEGNKKFWNPFTLRAWQHLRTNQPELVNAASSITAANDAGTKIKQIMSVG